MDKDFEYDGCRPSRFEPELRYTESAAVKWIQLAGQTPCEDT